MRIARSASRANARPPIRARPADCNASSSAAREVWTAGTMLKSTPVTTDGLNIWLCWRADPEREGPDCDRCEEGRLANQAQAVTKIGEKSLHGFR